MSAPNSNNQPDKGSNQSESFWLQHSPTGLPSVDALLLGLAVAFVVGVSLAFRQ